MALNIRGILGRLRSRGAGPKLKRRKALDNMAWTYFPRLKILLLVVGYAWMLCLPLKELSRGIYIDENALQPGGVNTNWNWGDVHRADSYLSELERLRDSNATSIERTDYISLQFQKLRIPTSIQNYTFYTRSGPIYGSNAYAILSSPRYSGAEATLISASWLSRMGDGDGTLNLRGVATVLSLAAFLNQYSLWSKDLIFVISDGYMEGMQAWASAYHGRTQSNMHAEPLQLTSGMIWTALDIDYPGHSFSHLGIFWEGLNGRLPNQDILNSFHVISRNTGGVPVLLHDNHDPNDDNWRDPLPVSWLPSTLGNNGRVKDYAYRARNLLRHVTYQARGHPSGIHGLLHQFHIDAFTIFAVPATGPHGFHTLGRIVESTLRTCNNLLERLHASFFFYLLPEPGTFTKIGNYLPSAVVISTAILFSGLRSWVQAGWVEVPVPASKEGRAKGSQVVKWERRSRPSLQAVLIILATHAWGVPLYFISTWPTPPRLLALACLCSSMLLASRFIDKIDSDTRKIAPIWMLLRSFNLCFASTVISATSVLNFSLAAVLAVLLGVPLSFSGPTDDVLTSVTLRFAYVLLAIFWFTPAWNVMDQAVWDWEFLGGYFSPFICMIYVPIIWQAVIVASLTNRS
ncbi:Gaa1-domain-containing protein [Thelephora ganbajun]|uniref:Gaa1-domain-containing protein n=1 Tax=Thelephora ganbajun TaxID=370292 RepID=A0ACB6ZD62_THEGA|nr:Gaa1-domain-containing protein [Thelephora ganbajun]